MSTEVNIAIVCITENGKNLALKIQTLIKDSHVYIVSNNQNKLQLENESKNIFLVKEKLSVLTERLFKDYQYILFIMATGIVVRVIAPYIVSKFSDPAIMVTDEKGEKELIDYKVDDLVFRPRKRREKVKMDDELKKLEAMEKKERKSKL